MDKKPVKIKTDSAGSAQCIFCTYQGSDLPNHYSTEHNVVTGSSKLLKPVALSSILNILSSSQHQPENGDMQMLDGTLIVIPEEPHETTTSHHSGPNNSTSRGSRKRKMYPPLSSNDTNNNSNGVNIDESEDSETNSENYSNQFVSNTSIMDNCLLLDSPNHNDPIPGSFIDSHMNNVLLSDDESSEHSSDLYRPLNGDSNSMTPNYGMRSSNNRMMSMFGPRMMRKRGRPPKISSQVLSKEEIEAELGPHVEIVDKVDGKDSVRIAAGEPYSVVVPLSLLVSAFDTDGVQYLKNLIRFYYKPEQLALFAWDVTQKRGRPRTTIAVYSDPNSNDVANINLQSLRQQSFVQASMRLIERMFGQAFPANLPIFINRLLQSHRFYVYGTTGSSSTVPNPSTNPLIYNDDTHTLPLSLTPVSVPASPYRDAECRLSRFWIQCADSDKDVRLTSSCPPIRKHLLVCAYDSDPVRFFRNLVRSALPLEELLHATWKGRNTGRPRFLSALPSDESLDDSIDENNKRPLIEHPLVQAFLDFVPRVCERHLPDNLGPVIHQLLATVRKTHCNNNGLIGKAPLSDD